MTGILLDDNYELRIEPVISNGLIVSGLVIGSTAYQRCRLIAEAQKGEIKEHPTLGFGIEKYLRSQLTMKQQFIVELQKELKSDGINTATVIVADDFTQLEITL